MDNKVIKFCVYMYAFFFIFFPIVVYYKILDIVPCATQ